MILPILRWRIVKQRSHGGLRCSAAHQQSLKGCLRAAAGGYASQYQPRNHCVKEIYRIGKNGVITMMDGHSFGVRFGRIGCSAAQTCAAAGKSMWCVRQRCGPVAGSHAHAHAFCKWSWWADGGVGFPDPVSQQGNGTAESVTMEEALDQSVLKLSGVEPQMDGNFADVDRSKRFPSDRGC